MRILIEWLVDCRMLRDEFEPSLCIVSSAVGATGTYIQIAANIDHRERAAFSARAKGVKLRDR